MIYRLFLFIIGSFRFRVNQYTTNTLNVLVRENINTYGMHKEGDALVFEIPSFSLRRLKKLFKQYLLPFPEGKLIGLPSYILRYRKRWGLVAGVLSLFAIIYLSSSFVWQINVIGNESVEDSRITGDLKELGFGVGSFIPSVNVKLLCNEYLLQNDDLSWMSINIIGNCVDIRVRESLGHGDKDAEDNTPSSIIASCDGFIERIVLKNGEIVKNAGSTIRKGETIVSGVVGKEDGTFRLVRSQADVYAKTSHSFSIDIPLEQVLTSEKEYKNGKSSILFFAKQFDLPGKNVSEDGLLARDTTKYLTLPGNITLPVGVVTRTFYKSEEKQIKISKEKAASLAREELASKIDSEFSSADILSISMKDECDNTKYRLEVTVYCIENIAQERKIVKEDYNYNHNPQKE